MEYTVNKLAQISGVTKRTLRYYDEIGLLHPMRVADNGYRIYGQMEVDVLQQILFYRELGVSLEEIGQILKAPDFDKKEALEGHLSALLQRKSQIELLIDNVTKTISSLKGETIMTDNEKFEGFKQKMIDDNEAAYGKEIREKYGDATIDACNAKVKGMSEEQWRKMQELTELINETIKEAIVLGDPASKTAQRACELHKEWICMFWAEGTYSRENHLALTQGYCEDERFKKYYEAIAPGAAEFLFEAMKIYYTL